MDIRRLLFVNSFSAETAFRRQNLTSVDVRLLRLKTVPVLKGSRHVQLHTVMLMRTHVRCFWVFANTHSETGRIILFYMEMLSIFFLVNLKKFVGRPASPTYLRGGDSRFCASQPLSTYHRNIDPYPVNKKHLYNINFIQCWTNMSKTLGLRCINVIKCFLFTRCTGI